VANGRTYVTTVRHTDANKKTVRKYKYSLSL